MSGSGPLAGVRVVELSSAAPGPFAAMLLADMGAEVIEVERVADVLDASTSPGGMAGGARVLRRGFRSIGVDLKAPAGRDVVRRLVRDADVLIEGFRPGVAERLGVGPQDCWVENARLVYGRVTGWGQHGPDAHRAGHDINYLAASGALGLIGAESGPPLPPVNLVADFAGGGMLCAFGVVCALVEARASGRGQVVDAAMVDGAALLTTLLHGFLAAGLWEERRGANLLDGAAPFYRCYETADGRWLAVGAIEAQFYAALLELLGLGNEALPPPSDRGAWPHLADRFATEFATRTLAEWVDAADGLDACVTPVVELSRAPDHAHNRARAAFVVIDGIPQPAPAPRFSHTPTPTPPAPPRPGAHTDEILSAAGFTEAEVARLRAAGAVA